MMPGPITLVRSSSLNGELAGTYEFIWKFKGVVPVRWAAFIDSYTPGLEFSDLQLRGVFRYFHHTHTCAPHVAGCRYTDTVKFRTLLGPALDGALLKREMQRLFAYRHDRMRELLT